jgi:hypothetical protein
MFNPRHAHPEPTPQSPHLQPNLPCLLQLEQLSEQLLALDAARRWVQAAGASEAWRLHRALGLVALALGHALGQATGLVPGMQFSFKLSQLQQPWWQQAAAATTAAAFKGYVECCLVNSRGTAQDFKAHLQVLHSLLQALERMQGAGGQHALLAVLCAKLVLRSTLRSVLASSLRAAAGCGAATAQRMMQCLLLARQVAQVAGSGDQQVLALDVELARAALQAGRSAAEKPTVCCLLARWSCLPALPWLHHTTSVHASLHACTSWRLHACALVGA